MKKIYLILVLALFGITITSCKTYRQTATSVSPYNEIITRVAADLEVSPQRISFTYEPLKREWKGGVNNVVKIATAKALQANGNGDVLVGLEYRVKTKITIFGSLKVEEITVTGFPAKYKNFRNLPDSVETPYGTILIK